MTTQTTPTLARAYESPAAWLRFLLPAVVGLAADLAVKAYAFPDFPVDRNGRHPGAPPIEIIPNFLGFITTVNEGAVFGMFQGFVFWFFLFSLPAVAVILWVFLTSRKNHWLVHLTLGMIMAGALGNLYDRAFYHGVRDMLKFLCFVHNGRDYYPYIFNIADALLFVAVPILMIRWLFIKDPQTESKV